MAGKETLYFTQEDLFRVGNSTSSKLADVRQGEVTLIEINGIETIVSNNQGVSLYNREGFEYAELSGWVYEIKASTPLPIGLRLWTDPQVKGHFPRLSDSKHAIQKIRWAAGGAGNEVSKIVQEAEGLRMREKTFTLNETSFNAVWRSLKDREEKLLTIIRTGDEDSDEVVFASNDIIYLRGLMKWFQEEATGVFSPSAFSTSDSVIKHPSGQ
jgi:hypothetical protein